MNTVTLTHRFLRRHLSAESTDTPFAEISKIYDNIHRLLPILFMTLSYFAFLQVWQRLGSLEGATSVSIFFRKEWYTPTSYLFFRWLPAPLLVLAALFPNRRLVVVPALLSFIHQGALVNAFEMVENQYRPSIWLAITLLFLPNTPSTQPKRNEKVAFISHFYFALIIFSFAYFAAGVWKILWGGVYQLLFESGGLWNPHAMSYIIVEYLDRTQVSYPAAEWIATLPLLGWLMLMAGTYVEATVWIVFFRPSLWKIYGALLVMLHFFSKLTLNIGFEAQYLFTGILFIASPFARDTHLIHALGQLPIIRLLRNLVSKTH
jgi:hypothetical protein